MIMKKNKMVKKVFPAGNTTKGFHSYFDYIIKGDANRIFILKGGPGVGKSTFMRKIASEVLEKGYSIEEHYCSSANNAIDAIVIPELQVALMDGTFPHMIDPKIPGAVDEIINLGDYWNSKGIRSQKEDLLFANKDSGKSFQRAYRYLKMLGQVINDISIIYQEGFDLQKYYEIQDDLIEEVFKDKVRKEKIGFERHLFSSGITPGGIVDYLETVVGVMNEIYYIKGNWGTNWSTLMDAISQKAVILGYDVEIYHTPLAPDDISDLVIPELNLAFTTSNKFEGDNKKKIDLDKLVDVEVLRKYKEELDFANRMYKQLLNQSIHYINKAKKSHDSLEVFYIPNMDFDAVNKKREEITADILSLGTVK